MRTKNRVETEIKQIMDYIETSVGGGSIIKRVCPVPASYNRR